MNTDIVNWCGYCTGCQTDKVSRHNRPVFGKFEEPTERFDHVHVDLVGPLPYSDGFKYLLTCFDRFTRWPEAILIIDISAETVADAFFGGWVARFGTPAMITTDRSAQFESRPWDTLCNQFCITRCYSNDTGVALMTIMGISVFFCHYKHYKTNASI